MGLFSFISTDTNKSIKIRKINKKFKFRTKKLITMIDHQGNKFLEYEYQGYGVFGGKDIFQLLAEMNNVENLTGNPEFDREKGIDLFYSNKEDILYPNLIEDEQNYNWVWTNKKLKLCPSQGL